VSRLLAAAAAALGVLALATSAAPVHAHGVDHAIVNVAKAGSGGGTVVSSPSGIDCGDTCSGSFLAGGNSDSEPFTLTGVPDPGSEFDGFEGCCPIQLVPGETYNVTAFFTRLRPTEFPLAVTVIGSGTVTSEPGGIACGRTCTASFSTDSSVTLAATPTPGWSFAGWTVGCTGTAACSIVMDNPRTVTATFAPPETVHALSVATAGGSVTSDVPGVECGAACVAAFGAGVDVTLTPSSGPVVWGGACTGSDACVVSMTSAKAVTASIAGAALERVPLAVGKTGKGSIVGSSPEIACGETCGALLAIGARTTLQAIPDPGWTFAGWSGSCRGVAATCTLTLRAAASAVASFVEAGTLFPLAVTKVGHGTVTSEPAGIDCGDTCSSGFPAGSTVTIEARAKNTKWEFVRWDGACNGRKPTCTVPLDGAKSTAATFGRVADPTPPRVKALASSGKLGRIAQVRYRVIEASGRSRETATILRGKRRLATVGAPMHAVDPDALYYFIRWRSTARGKLRFCVVSTDVAGNRSKPSCAPLHIT
jgi:uncharacterized repeat protein (TIGR02543 family)